MLGTYLSNLSRITPTFFLGSRVHCNVNGEDFMGDIFHKLYY